MNAGDLEGRGGQRALLAALVFAIALCPFVGGVRGVPPYLGWVLIPLAAVGFAPRRARSELYLDLPGGSWRGVFTVLVCAGVGAACGLAWLRLGRGWPGLIEFVRLLPWLHRELVGGRVWLFLALIPAAHVAHELFYRAFVQQRLAARLGLPAGVLLGALLFAWTHVFVFSSGEYLGALAALRGTAGPEAAGQTLAAVIGFCSVEALVGGTLLARTRSLWSAVAFRAANLLVITLALHADGRLVP